MVPYLKMKISNIVQANANSPKCDIQQETITPPHSRHSNHAGSIAFSHPPPERAIVNSSESGRLKTADQILTPRESLELPDPSKPQGTLPTGASTGALELAEGEAPQCSRTVCPSDGDGRLEKDGVDAVEQAEEGGGIVVDQEDLASDAGYESDIYTSTSTSLTSSVRNYIFENGRRYHRFREGRYNFPNDDVEQEREDMKHAMIIMLCQQLHFAPIGDVPLHILDIGTGTGSWAIESELPSTPPHLFPFTFLFSFRFPLSYSTILPSLELAELFVSFSNYLILMVISSSGRPLSHRRGTRN